MRVCMCVRVWVYIGNVCVYVYIYIYIYIYIYTLYVDGYIHVTHVCMNVSPTVGVLLLTCNRTLICYSHVFFFVVYLVYSFLIFLCNTSLYFCVIL
jgi:hypothetical protein